MNHKRTLYAVQTVPMRDAGGRIAGWVRTGIHADGTNPHELLYLADGSACTEVEAIRRVNRDRSLLFSTRDAAARDGLARLMLAHPRTSTPR